MDSIDNLADELGQPDAPVADAPVDKPVAAPAQPPVEDLWEVKVNGRASKVPRDEVIAGYQRQQDYTRKTMEIAEERRKFQEQLTQLNKYESEREQLKKFLSDREAVAAYLKQLSGDQPPANEPLTGQHAQQMIQAQMARHQAALDERLAQMTQELEVRQLASQYATEIDSAIATALNEFPELKSVRRIQQVLREEVAEREPTTIEETKLFFREVAKEQADQLRSLVEARQKEAAAAASKLQRGIEPPGGTGVQPKPRPAFKFGDPRLLDELVKELGEVQNER